MLSLGARSSPGVLTRGTAASSKIYGGLAATLRRGDHDATAISSAGPVETIFKRFATKKAAGQTRNTSQAANPKFLGPKKWDGEFVHPGQIIMRQRGNRIFPGLGVGQGRDHTLYAQVPGVVRYYTQSERFIPAFRVKPRKMVTVISERENELVKARLRTSKTIL
ncbi:54S ribosomal protein L2, mitochondrial [Balamuthia mandrillaris]